MGLPTWCNEAWQEKEPRKGSLGLERVVTPTLMGCGGWIYGGGWQVLGRESERVSGFCFDRRRGKCVVESLTSSFNLF